MPTYNMRCTQCDETFSIMVKYSELNLSQCPHCKSKDIERVFMGSCVAVGGRSGKDHPG